MIGSLKHRILRPIIINPPYSNFYRNLASKFLNISNSFTKSELSDFEKSKVKDLKEDGCFSTDIDQLNLKDQFERLSNEVLKIGFTESGNFKDIKNEKLLEYVKTKMREDEVKGYKISLSELLSQNLIKDFTKNEKIKKIASNYLNVNIKNTYVDVLLDHNLFENKETTETQLFHRDHNGILFLKVFIYLTDVKIENGPYSYVKSTHNKKFIRKFKLKKNKIRKNYRYNNNNVYDQLRHNEMIFKGNKGTVIFSDTTGLHRGYLPESDYYRILLSMTFEPENSFLTFTE